MSARRGAGEHAFSAVSALLFVISAAATIIWCRAMANSSSMPAEMPMPGGWTMSMAWMRMPDQTWAGAAASFLGMWIVMMVAMMLPSLLPMLRRYRAAVGGSGASRLGPLTALVGGGYFFVWMLLGVAAFPLGVALAEVEMRQPAVARAVPIGVGCRRVAVRFAAAHALESPAPRLLPGHAAAPPRLAGRPPAPPGATACGSASTASTVARG